MMTTTQDKDIKWISCKDLKKTKLCNVCWQPMTVKQMNLTEACRACFNPQCSPQLLDVPDLEYIQRSYMDIPEEGERKKQDFTSKPTSLEDEVDKVTKLFCEVESMVSRRLGKEYWMIGNIPSSSMKQPKDLNCVNFSKEPSFHKLELQDDQLSEKFQIKDTPKWLFEQPAISDETSFKVEVPNVPDKHSAQLCWNSHSENSFNAVIEQIPGSDIVMGASHSTHAKETEKTTGKPVTFVDSTQNELWQPAVLAEKATIDIGSMLPAFNSFPDCDPSKENAAVIQPTSLNSTTDVENNLLVLNKGASVLGACLKFDVKGDDVSKDKSIRSELMPAFVVKKDVKDIFAKGKTSNLKTEVIGSNDFRVRVTNGFRCYRPSKRRNHVESFNSNLLQKASISIGPDCEASLSHLVQSIEEKESGVKKEESEFKAGITNLEKISLQRADVPVNQTVVPLKFTVVPVQNGVSKIIDLSQNSNLSIHLNSPATSESNESFAFEESVTNAPIKNIQAPPKGGEKKSQKSASHKIGSVSRTKTSLPDILKGNSKPVVGFNELKSFGGAKCSFMVTEAKSKPSKQSRKKRAIKNTKTQSKPRNIPESKSIDDDIEKAIAEVQHASVRQDIEWEQMFSDLIKTS